jgi:hypothetical protein
LGIGAFADQQEGHDAENRDDRQAAAKDYQ